MNIRYQFRKIFDATMRALPRAVHTALLKSYSNMPDLALASRFRCYPQVYYSPLIDPHEIDLTKLGEKRQLPGIQIDCDRYVQLFDTLEQWVPELTWMPRSADGEKVKWHETFTSLDSAALYCMLRHLKPKRFIEVGCGFSSGVSSEALRRNEAEGVTCAATYIEPYPGPRLDGVNLHGEFLCKKIEEVELEYFNALDAGDVLFIDTSHVIKCQNDVYWELVHILPSLKPGVHVHIHDIYTPYEQPYDWLLGRNDPGAANEQYAVECLLSGGDDYAITLPLHLIGREEPDLASRLAPGFNDIGQSLWLLKHSR